jgi:hypothetical protein
MRRRGGLLGSGRRRLERRHPLRAAALRALGRAHNLLNQGQPAEAAPIFAQLASGAEMHEMPARGAQLHLQAARCLALTGVRPAMLEHALQAVALLAGAGEVAQLSIALPRFIQDLRAQNFTAEADQVQQAVTAALGPTPATLGASARPNRRLPAMCPQCSGPVRSDEVEWIDDTSAECSYCGSVLLSLA